MSAGIFGSVVIPKRSSVNTLLDFSKAARYIEPDQWPTAIATDAWYVDLVMLADSAFFGTQGVQVIVGSGGRFFTPSSSAYFDGATVTLSDNNGNTLASSAVTFAAGATPRVKVDHVAEELTLTGFLTGNGVFPFSGPSTWDTAGASVVLSAGGNFSGDSAVATFTVGNIKDPTTDAVIYEIINVPAGCNIYPASWPAAIATGKFAFDFKISTLIPSPSGYYNAFINIDDSSRIMLYNDIVYLQGAGNFYDLVHGFSLTPGNLATIQIDFTVNPYEITITGADTGDGTYSPSDSSWSWPTVGAIAQRARANTTETCITYMSNLRTVA